MRTREKAPAGVTAPTGAGNTTHRAGVDSSVIVPQQGEKPKTLFVRADEIMELLGVSRATACRCIQQVNKRAKAAGLFTVTGFCNRRLFMEFIGYPSE